MAEYQSEQKSSYGIPLFRVAGIQIRHLPRHTFAGAEKRKRQPTANY